MNKLIINTTELNQLIKEGLVTARRHKTFPLTIYNYTAKTQYSGHWNNLTKICRGLILSDDGKIIANPFPKFFNLGEHEPNEIPKEAFQVYEKLDGSLGVMYFWEEKPYIASRGSFDSDQAIKANDLLTSLYAASIPLLDQTKTYLFEIIYPDNRIVVDYGQREELTLLAVRDTATGINHPMKRIGFPIAKRYHYDTRDFKVLEKLQNDVDEGLVLVFDSGFRAKVKFPEYVRLHKVLTGISPKSIWESLKNGDDLSKVLDHVPDEFFTWVKSIESELKAKHKAIELYCQKHFKGLGDRKTTAEYFKTLDYPAILFRMLDSKPYDDLIWKIIKPDSSSTFKLES